MEVFYALLVMGLFFGFLGALTAYLITHKDWTRHYPDKQRPRKIAFETAVFAFLIFFLIALFTGLLFKQ